MILTSIFLYFYIIILIDIPNAQPANLIASCRTDNDCKSHSLCYGKDDNGDGKCKCLDDYNLFRNSTFYDCIKIKKIGDSCQTNHDCLGTTNSLTICTNEKVCNCSNEAHNVNGKCYSKVKLGEVCMTKENCFIEPNSKNVSLALCEKGLCTCPPDQVASEDGSKCFPTLGQPCDTDEECTMATPNSRCEEVCRCIPTHTVSRNEKSCVKAATHFDDPCEYDGQCSKHLQESVCNNEKCGCEENYHEYRTSCVQTRNLGEQCTTEAECLYEKNLEGIVKCESQVCKCLHGNAEDGFCRKVKEEKEEKKDKEDKEVKKNKEDKEDKKDKKDKENKEDKENSSANGLLNYIFWNVLCTLTLLKL